MDVQDVWLSGPVEGVDPVLLPAVHAFRQVRHDAASLLAGLTFDQLWQRPGRSASIGYHAVHLAGATDRLLSYARGEGLSDQQRARLKAEATTADLDAAQLIARIESAMDHAVEEARRTSTADVLAPRAVGRQGLPSTVLGLIYHAAEHATRHMGQIATLRRVLE
ncbi:MAG: DinB family protein [Acidobacteriota bacterium]